MIEVFCQPHYGGYLVTTPSIDGGSTLMSTDDVAHMLGSQYNPEGGDQCGHVSDDYLEVFSKPFEA
jgi:hypothetical protein